MTPQIFKLGASAAALLLLAQTGFAAEDAANPNITAKVEITPEYLTQNITPSYQDETGRWFTADDIPTYFVEPDGNLGWFTYSGYVRYGGNCLQCHGPDGEGSTYAPAIKNSALELDYYEFVDVVTNGRKNVSSSQESVMPAWGTDPNVMCYLDSIYSYLKGRGMDAIPRGRPKGHAAKSDAAREVENACLGVTDAAPAKSN